MHPLGWRNSIFPSVGEVSSWYKSHRSSGQKQVTGPQLPAEPGSGCPNLSQYVVQHSQPQARLEKHRAVGKVVVVGGSYHRLSLFLAKHGTRTVRTRVGPQSQGKFLLVLLQYPMESVALVHCRRWSQKILWAWLELFKVLLGYPLTPCFSSGQYPQCIRQSKSNKLKIDHLDCPGSSLPAQASQSKLDRRSVCCTA